MVGLSKVAHRDSAVHNGPHNDGEDGGGQIGLDKKEIEKDKNATTKS